MCHLSWVHVHNFILKFNQEQTPDFSFEGGLTADGFFSLADYQLYEKATGHLRGEVTVHPCTLPLDPPLINFITGSALIFVY